jgi:thioredoxin reductase
MKTKYDYIIVGAGPAGVQLAYFLQQQGYDYLLLERGSSAGTFFKKFPRHRTLISINKVHTGIDDPEINLRWDWNSLLTEDDKFRFKKYSKEYYPNPDCLVKYLQDYTKKYKLNIRCNSTVKKISKKKQFIVELDSGKKFTAERVIIATGPSTPYIPDIKGIEHAKNYVDLSLDKKLFTNKRMLIIGKGNSSFETAEYLVDTASLIHMASPNPIKMAWRTHHPGHLRAIHNNFLDTYQLKSQNAIINSYIEKIEKKGKKFIATYAYTLANGEKETIEYDYVVNCTGFRLDTAIFSKSVMPKLTINDRYADLTSWYESVNVKDLYFIGNLMQVRDYKKKQSAFIHGFRYNIKFLTQYFAKRYHRKPFACAEIKASSTNIMRKIIQRVNKTSALWQQTGYLGDVLVYDNNKKVFYYYEEFPIDYVHEVDLAKREDYFTVTLEFGQERIDQYQNVFAIDRVHKDDFLHAYLSTGIHPIVRHYRNQQFISEHHLIEDFDSIWAEKVHREPLQAYFDQALIHINSRNYTKIPQQ